MAAIVAAVIAAPVLRAPSDRIFGMDIVGRHHDPFTVMEQFARPIGIGMYSQPVTDIAGALIARIAGAVAAYNWLVLLSFPFAAAATYALARHLALAPTGARVAAMAYAFAPFHLAQAAYHPHVAQTQWIPLYLLALWRCLDDATPVAIAFLVVATAAVTLSNFYGGMIAAVITPVAAAAYWLVMDPTQRRSMRSLAATVSVLAFMGAAGFAYVWYAAHAVATNRMAFAFPRDDLFRYSAKWWSYLVPPIEHPLLGAPARRLWTAAGVREGLLEHQVSLGWSIVALGGIAIVRWAGRDRETASLARVPAIVLVAITALVCSLSPERIIDGVTLVRPSALLYHVVPMFRSYARFGVVVQLMAALLAGIGVDALRRSATRRAHIVAAALVILAIGEYAVWPPTMWRDVLPTAAHRWVVQQPGTTRALDCTPFDQESESVQWLTNDRIALLGGPVESCTDGELAHKLAARGYSYLIVRRASIDGRSFADDRAPTGMSIVGGFADGQVLAVNPREQR